MALRIRNVKLTVLPSFIIPDCKKSLIGWGVLKPYKDCTVIKGTVSPQNRTGNRPAIKDEAELDWYENGRKSNCSGSH